MKALFVAIEGVDGAGKSQLAKSLVASLCAIGHRAIRTHEPGSVIEDHIRGLFKRETIPAPDYMTLMFTADRLIHMETRILPALADGYIVICDRHKLSTLVYQTASGANPEFVRMACDIPQPSPDLTIVLDLDPAVAAQRMRGRKLDAYERDREKQIRMRAAYLEHRNRFGDSVVIDASQHAGLVLDQSLNAIMEKMK